jgi:hypothetical protein
MTKDEINNVAKEWISLQSSGYPDDLDGDGVDVNMLAMEQPEDCWKVILEVLNITDDEWVLVNLGAGPLESLLAMHGTVVIPWIGQEVRLNKRFKTLLGGVWRNSIQDDVWHQLQGMV